MNVGILGSGDVAQSLGTGFLKHGHSVMLGTRDPAKLAQWQAANPEAQVGSFEAAARFAELAILATLGSAVADVLQLAGTANFDGKTVIDATNPLRFDESGPHLSIGFDDSQGEQVQRLLPNAHVVKAFNIVGHDDMVDPQFDGGPPTMLIAGNDEGAKKTVTSILESFGWDVADLGGIEASRYLEPICLAWVLYAIRNGSRHHAFKLLR